MATRPAEEATHRFAVINLAVPELLSPGELLEARPSVATFVRDVGGIESRVTRSAQSPLYIQISAPSEFELCLRESPWLLHSKWRLRIGDGVVNNQMAAVFDIPDLKTTAVEPSVFEAVHGCSDGSRNPHFTEAFRRNDAPDPHS